MTLRPWEVHLAHLDPVEGHEQGGQRPVVVISSDFHLRVTRQRLVTVVPLTSRYREGWVHHVPIGGLRLASFAITEQMRSLATSRIEQRVLTVLTDAEQDAMRQALTRMMCWTTSTR